MGLRSQGGARVTRVVRTDGVRTDSVTTDYVYPDGGGFASGVPPRYLDRLKGRNGLFVGTGERGRAAVYYDWVERRGQDGSAVRTTYTTANTSTSTKTLETVLWRTPSAPFPDQSQREAYTAIVGNQDWTWGLPIKVESKEPTGATWRTVLETQTTRNLTAQAVAFPFKRSVPAGGGVAAEVSVDWGYPDQVTRETTIDRGLSGNTAVSTTRDYVYSTGATGNGRINQADETHEDGRKRRTYTTFGHTAYTALDAANRLDVVVQERTASVLGLNATFHAASATTWRSVTASAVPGGPSGTVALLVPYQTHVWNNATPSTTSPSFTAWTGTSQSGWQLKETLDTYDRNGHATRVLDGRSNATTLSYNNLGQLTRVVAPTVNSVALERRFTYEPTLGLLSRLVDENGNVSRFAYDDNGRLATTYVAGKASADTTAIKATYGYAFTAVPYRVTTTAYVGSSSSNAQVTHDFFDGLGRPVQTLRVVDASTALGTLTDYYPGTSARGPMVREWNPTSLATTGTFVPSATFDSAARNGYSSATCDDGSIPDPGPAFAGGASTSSSGTATAPYTDTEAARDGTGRTVRVASPWSTTCALTAVTTAYATGTVDGVTYSYEETTDEAGEKSRTYSDGWGNAFRSVTAVGSAVAATTHTVFDVMGQPTEVRPPNYFAPPSGTAANWTTSYAYDTQGRMTSRTTPDARTANGSAPQPTELRYDAADNLRFVRDANQKAAGRVLFTTYDALNRPVHSGQYATATLPDGTSSNSWETASANWLQTTAYDAKPATGSAPWSAFSAQITAAPSANLKGHVTGTASRPVTTSSAWQVELSDADGEQRYARRLVHTASDGGTVDAALSTDLRYTYDRQGQLLTRANTVGTGTGAKSFYHWYEYDRLGREAKVFAAPTSAKPSTPDVAHTYTATPHTLTTAFTGSSTLRRHDVRGRVSNIGGGTWKSALSGSVPFVAHYDYAADGQVDKARFGYRTSSAAARAYDQFAFSYDARDRLTAADYSSSADGNAWTTTSFYDLSAITYDPNGNLKTLTRRDKAGAVVDQLTYAYTAGTNRLASLTDAAAAGAATWDADTGAFGYDANGNATAMPAPYSVTSATYDHRNLPLRLKGVDSHTPTFKYSASGQRTLVTYGYSELVTTDPGAGALAAGPHRSADAGAPPAAGTGGTGREVVGEAAPRREAAPPAGERPQDDRTPPRSTPARSASPWASSPGTSAEPRSERPAAEGTATEPGVRDPGSSQAASREAAGDEPRARAEASRSPFARRTSPTSAAPADSSSGLGTPEQPIGRSTAASPAPQALASAESSSGETSSAQPYTALPSDSTGASEPPTSGDPSDPGSGSAALSDTPAVRTEYTILDAHMSGGLQPVLGTLTRAGGTVTVEWAVLSASGEPLGRQPASGARQFFHKDLLGSTRLVADAAGAVIEAEAYDAMGVVLDGRGKAQASEPARPGFTGKERLHDFGGGRFAGLDDFGARAYAPAFGRWLQVDPLAEKHPDWTPYNYVLADPMTLVDPDGRQVVANMMERTKEAAKNAGAFVHGAATAIVDNFTPFNMREQNGRGLQGRAGAYNMGQDAGDLASVGLGATEAGFGAMMTVGGTAASATGGGVVVGAPAVVAGPALAAHGAAGAARGTHSLVTQQGRITQARGRSGLQPDPNARGPHSTSRIGPDGQIRRHETWDPNPRNPRGWDSRQSTDLSGRPHTNKKTGKAVPTPHTQGRNIPGGVRPARADEIPRRRN